MATTTDLTWDDVEVWANEANVAWDAASVIEAACRQRRCEDERWEACKLLISGDAPGFYRNTGHEWTELGRLLVRVAYLVDLAQGEAQGPDDDRGRQARQPHRRAVLDRPPDRDSVRAARPRDRRLEALALETMFGARAARQPDETGRLEPLPCASCAAPRPLPTRRPAMPLIPSPRPEHHPAPQTPTRLHLRLPRRPLPRTLRRHRTRPVTVPRRTRRERRQVPPTPRAATMRQAEAVIPAGDLLTIRGEAVRARLSRHGSPLRPGDITPLALTGGSSGGA